jgi:hypothetical protein
LQPVERLPAPFGASGPLRGTSAKGRAFALGEFRQFHSRIPGVRTICVLQFASVGKQAMTRTQYRKALRKLGLTQVQAAAWLDVSIRSAHGWANGTPIPVPVAKLLQLMLKFELMPDDV